MTERVSVARDGQAAARRALERCVGAGGVAVFPSDGLYGLCCDPLSAQAVHRIHEIKGRDDGKPSAVLYLDPLLMRELLGGLGERAAAGVARLLPGPVTLVIANPDHRYPLAARGDPERLGVRLIAGPLAGAGVVLFQTSANRSGEPATGSLAEVDPAVLAGADLVIDGGKLSGSPSTVVDISRIDADGTWTLIRAGAMPEAELVAALGPGDGGGRRPPG